VTKIRQIAAKNVTVGSIIWKSGCRWIVKANTYDPRGNTGTQQRQIFTCDAAEPQQMEVETTLRRIREYARLAHTALERAEVAKIRKS
jgi:hypothetical protein